MPATFIDGHQLFQDRYFGGRDYLRSLAENPQRPRALFVGCSDSRVVPEYLTSAGFGDLFVLRNIANFVPEKGQADASVGAAIDYAIGPLKVPDIIVCGHYGCGGVEAALKSLEPLKSFPSLYRWLGEVAPGVRRVLGQGTPAEVWRRGVEENVLQSLENLITYDVVRSALESGAVRLHAWIYDIYGTRISALDPASGRFVDAIVMRSSDPERRRYRVGNVR